MTSRIIPKDPHKGVQGSKNLAPSIFTYYGPKSNGICNKINFYKQIRREDKWAYTSRPFAIGCPLAPRFYLLTFSRYSTPKSRAHTQTDRHTDRHTPQVILYSVPCNVLPGIVSSGKAWERRSQSYFDSGNGVPRNSIAR